MKVAAGSVNGFRKPFPKHTVLSNPSRMPGYLPASSNLAVLWLSAMPKSTDVWHSAQSLLWLLVDWCIVALLNTQVSCSLSTWFSAKTPSPAMLCQGGLCSPSLWITSLMDSGQPDLGQQEPLLPAMGVVGHRKSPHSALPSITHQCESWAVVAITLTVWGAAKWDRKIWPFSHHSESLTVHPAGLPIRHQ